MYKYGYIHTSQTSLDMTVWVRLLPLLGNKPMIPVVPLRDAVVKDSLQYTYITWYIRVYSLRFGPFGYGCLDTTGTFRKQNTNRPVVLLTYSPV